MTHYLSFPDRATWDAFGWYFDPQQPKYCYGPEGQSASIVGDNYFEHEDGTRELRPGFLVNIAGNLPEAMAEYALAEPPKNPKEMFA